MDSPTRDELVALCARSLAALDFVSGQLNVVANLPPPHTSHEWYSELRDALRDATTDRGQPPTEYFAECTAADHARCPCAAGPEVEIIRCGCPCHLQMSGRLEAKSTIWCTAPDGRVGDYLFLAEDPTRTPISPVFGRYDHLVRWAHADGWLSPASLNGVWTRDHLSVPPPTGL